MKNPVDKIKIKEKRMLLISYHFPPSSAVGGVRISYFAKNLPRFGWRSYVLTIKDHYIERLDTERLNGIEGIKIFKAGQLPTIIQGYSRIKTICYSFLKKTPMTLKEVRKSSFQSDNKLSGKENIIQKLKRYFFSLALLPDGENSWILPAFLKGIKVIRHKKIDYILTSCPPYSVHLVGLLLKKITGVRWVADFRDPWTICGPKTLFPNSNLSIKIEKWLERKVIENADIILSTTENLCKAFLEFYKEQPANKFLYIPNGYDPETFFKFNGFKRYKRFTLTYAGSFYLTRTPEPIFTALRELIKEGRLNAEDIRVNLMGNCQHVNGCPTSQIISAYGLGQTVHVLGLVSHHKALKLIKKSHLALLLAENQPFQIPAKVYDYMGAGTKILAVAEKGATSDLIISTKIGEVFRPGDVEGIKRYIYECFRNEKSGLLETNSEIFSKFDIRVILKNLIYHIERQG